MPNVKGIVEPDVNGVWDPNVGVGFMPILQWQQWFTASSCEVSIQRVVSGDCRARLGRVRGRPQT